jgi:hypothetical protein
MKEKKMENFFAELESLYHKEDSSYLEPTKM